MSAGGVWVAGSDSNSAARLNQKTVTIDTSANLSGMTTYPGQLVFSTDGLAPFNNPANTLYERNLANNGWIAIVPMTVHDHSTNQASTGGLLSDVFIANTGQLNYQNELMSPRASDFNTANSTLGGTVTETLGSGNWRVGLNTTTTIGSTAQADFGGIRLDFGSNMKFQAKVEHTGGTTSVQARIGVNIEAANAAIGAPPVKSLGFEFCDSTGTVYQVVSSDGGIRSTSPTTVAFTGVHSIRFIYTKTQMIATVDQTVGVTKTTNMPGTGQVDADKNMRFGIQNSTTTASTKSLNIYGAVIAGTVNDTWYV